MSDTYYHPDEVLSCGHAAGLGAVWYVPGWYALLDEDGAPVPGTVCQDCAEMEEENGVTVVLVPTAEQIFAEEAYELAGVGIN